MSLKFEPQDLAEFDDLEIHGVYQLICRHVMKVQKKFDEEQRIEKIEANKKRELMQ